MSTESENSQVGSDVEDLCVDGTSGGGDPGSASIHFPASPSQDPPVHPPPPPDFEGPPIARPRRPTRAFSVFNTEYGKVTHYITGHRFEAVCRFPGHGDCRLTRTANGPSGTAMLTDPHRGRPLGFLVAWLKAASPVLPGEVSTHKFHKPNYAARRAARTIIKNAEEPASNILDCERQQAAYEPDSEPSDQN